MTVVYRGDNILRGFDEDIRAHLRAEMEKQGINIITGCTVDKVDMTATSSPRSCRTVQPRRRPGDVRDRPASERRQISGWRTAGVAINPKKAASPSMVVEDLGAATSMRSATSPIA